MLTTHDHDVISGEEEEVHADIHRHRTQRSPSRGFEQQEQQNDDDDDDDTPKHKCYHFFVFALCRIYCKNSYFLKGYCFVLFLNLLTNT